MTAAAHEGSVALSPQEHFAVSQFLFRESALLDADRYDEWLDLLAPDIRYRVSARTVRSAGQEPRSYLIVDNIADELRMRVAQISNPKLTYSENPPSITRRFVANVLAESDEQTGDIAVASNILLFRSHGVDGDQYIYPGIRHDRLLVRNGDYLLAERNVTLDISVISSMNVTVLF